MKLGVTGHRLQTLRREDPLRDIDRMIDLAREGIKFLKPNIISIGMAQGWDTAVALASLELGIPFNAIMPFPKEIMTKYWSTEDTRILNFLLTKAFTIHYIEKVYKKSAYLIRDEFIVDHSNHMMILWDGRKTGGTKYTMDYAIEKSIPIQNMYDLDIRIRYG